MLWACRNRFAKGTGTNPMFRAASVRFRMVLFKWVPIVCGFAWFFLSWFFLLYILFILFIFFLFYIKWVPKATFRHFSGCGFAMAWAQTCWGSAFSHARPKHLFLEFGLVACRLPSLTLRKGLPCLRQPFFLFLVGSKSNVSHFLCSAFFVGSTSNVSAVFWLRFRMVWAYIYIFLSNGLQQRRFGIFSAAVSQWLGHKTCWGSAFSHARPKHLFLEFGLVACRFFLSGCGFAWFGPYFFLFLMGSNSDVSAFFRLRFRNGLGTKPAGVLPFRMSQTPFS